MLKNSFLSSNGNIREKRCAWADDSGAPAGEGRLLSAHHFTTGQGSGPVGRAGPPDKGVQP